MLGGRPISFVVVNSNADERWIEKEAGQGVEVLTLSLNRGGMQRRIRATGCYRSNLAPLRLEIGIARTKNDAYPETVESLIAGKRLMAGIIDEDEKIVGVG
jgi:hypothetical protein